jgi:preprotein translocase subunit YajC
MSSYYVVAIVVFVGILWLLLVVPQRRMRRRHEQVVGSLAIGDRVITIGGFHGVVRSLNDDTVQLEIAPGVATTLSRQAIASVLPPGTESGTDENSTEGSSS